MGPPAPCSQVAAMLQYTHANDMMHLMEPMLDLRLAMPTRERCEAVNTRRRCHRCVSPSIRWKQPGCNPSQPQD